MLLSLCSFNVFQWLPSYWHWAIPQSTISASTWRAPNWRCYLVWSTSLPADSYPLQCKFQVIKTIPFDQLNIEVISVEFNLLGRLEISKMGQKRGENVLQDFSWLSCSSPLSPWPCWLLLHRNPWRWKRWGFKWWLKLLQKKTTSLLNPSCWRGNTSFRERQCLRMSGLSSPFGTLMPPICYHRKNTEKDSKRLLSLLHELSLIISQKRFNPEKSSLPLVRNLSAQMWLSFFPISWT